MSLATTGIELRARSRVLRDSIELVSSMRFAISLLTVICIASTIGTVVRQHEPAPNYINQFGPFWAEVYTRLGLTTVYSAWWFLLILAVLVVSTSLCIARNTPKILHDLSNFKEQVREQALQAFHLKGEAHTAESREAATERVSRLLLGAGWKAKAQARDNGTMIAARRGAANKLGYIAAHSAIVLVCVGGLLDGDLVVRLEMALQGKSVYSGEGLIRDVPANYRLSAGNPTFRANLRVPENGRSGVAIIGMQDGVVLQELPFDVELKKFIVDYYATGMPKLFASDVVIHDRDTGASTPATIKVNEPVVHRGIAIYQSGFEDGGSTLKLRAIPMHGGRPFTVDGVVGTSATLANATNAAGDKEALGIEFTDLRVINVENFGGRENGTTDVRRVDLVASLQDHLGSGAKVSGKRELRNIGPSVGYKLVDASGQRREFKNYMLPVELDGQRVFLAGVRDNVNDGFRFMRIPADDSDRIDTWARLREALADPAWRAQAVARYVGLATPADKPQMGPQLTTTATRVLALFAGAEPVKAGQPAVGGLQAVSDFIEGNVPEADRSRISDVLLRILNGSLFELANLTRENAGLKALAADERSQAFMTMAELSLSESFAYPAPVLLELTDFKQVQASVFQVARAPGKTLVYLGAVLLILGVFAMLYIRERRLWVWIAPRPEGGTKLVAALSTTRRTMDADAEFELLKQAILRQPGHPAVRLDVSHRDTPPEDAP